MARTVIMSEQLLRLYELAVRDAQGRLYMPLFGYDERVEAYAPAREALETFFAVRGHDYA